ncbi:IMP dehydrogenase [Deltaproteobacteria bacterium TL4]
MQIRAKKGLTFDDVLLVPKRSPVDSRFAVDTSTWLTRKIPLNIPILSSNMDTVTESAMAIAMAKTGGIGIIHRFMSIEQQVRQVERVKSSEVLLLKTPHSISQDELISKARKRMQDLDVGGLVVTNVKKQLIGIVTQRDILLAPNENAKVSSVMTTPDHIVSATPEISREEAQKLLHEHRLEKLPIVDSKGQLVGLITAQDIIKHQQSPNSTQDQNGCLRVGAAIGIQATDLERAEKLVDAEVDVLVVDIAHGHADHCLQRIKELRKRFPAIQIIAGNIASKEAARDLAEAGVDAIKVGIGPGSICTTRIVTGFGVPQLTAIMDSVEGLMEAKIDIPIIADGGIRTSGDLAKAIAAGASTVMIGSLFAGCEEAPGATVIRDGQKVKVVRGMASLGAAIERKISESSNDESAEHQKDWDKVVPEGVEAVVPYRGSIQEIIYQLVGGLRSALSYGGALNLRELQEKAEFIEITPAGLQESHFHNVHKI